ncbi:1718_t:CDS:2, partial [Racocetra fulgida]
MKSNAKKDGLEVLKAQLHQYACNKEPYNRSYISTLDRTKNLESMVKISSYLMSNAKQELHYYGLDLTKEELQTIFQDIDLFSEINEENINNLDNLSEFANSSDPEIEYQNLELENFIELNKVESNTDDENIDKNNEELDEEFNAEEFDEYKFGAE